MGNAARITLNGALPSGEAWQAGFVIHKDDGTDMTIADAVAAGDAWLTGFVSAGPGLRVYYNPATTFNPIKAQLIDGVTGAPGRKGLGTVSSNGSGNAATAVLPPEVAVVITLRGSGAYTGTHGRFYLPAPLSTACTANGRLLAAAQTAYGSAVAQAATQMSLATSATFKMAIWSEKHSTVTTARRAEVGDVFDSQRSRRNKLVEKRTPIIIGTAF